MKAIKWIAVILVIVGGINWGLVGVSGLDLVQSLVPGIANWVYILVGLSAIYMIFMAKKAVRD